MTVVKLGVLKRRTLPFFQVGEDEMALIAEHSPPRQLAYARSVYVELLRAAHAARSDEFELGRTALARGAGISTQTLDRVLPALAAAGVVQPEGSREDGTPKRWILLGGFLSQRKGVPLGEEGGDPSRGTPPSRVENEVRERDREKGSLGEQTSLDVPEEKVEAFVRWHADQLRARSLPLPAMRGPHRQAARDLLRLAPGADLRAMFEFAIGRTFWASKVLTLPKWRQHYAALRAEWAASANGSGGQRRDEPYSPPPSKSTCYLHDRMVTYDGPECPVCAKEREETTA